MKKLGVLAFGLVMSAAVFAQDEASTEPTTDSSYAEPAADQGDAGATESSDAAVAEDAAMADEAAPADAGAAEAGATDDGSAESGSADAGGADAAADTGASDAAASDSYGADSSTGDSYSAESTEEPSTEEAATEETGAEGEGEPSKFYVGGDYVWTSVSFSKDSLAADFGAEELDSKMYRVRAGMRLFEAVGLEAQIGFDGGSSDDPLENEYNTKQFYGVYLVPTGVLFDLVEVGGAIGYASTRLERANASETLSGASFGVNLDIPLFTSDAFELRVGGGATVFRAQNSARIHGYHAGVRIDFSI